MPRTDVIDELDRLAAAHRRRLRAGANISDRIAQAEAAAKAAALRPALSNTLYRGTERATDPEFDAFERRNRALQPDQQVD